MKLTLRNCSLLIFGCLTLLVSCSKNEKTESFQVKYSIVPFSTNVTKITYTDANGSSVVINDYNEFLAGKSIAPSSKPFNAKISIEAYNTTTVTENFNLVIEVDGVTKAVQPVSLPPMSNGTGQAMFTVQ